MTSRRDILTGVGAISLASLAGCPALNRSEDSPDTVGDESTGTPPSTAEFVNSATGRVWYKEIEVTVGGEESTLWTDVLRLTFDREANEVWGQYDPEYVGDSVDGASVSVSENVHNKLQNTFEEVRYAIRLGPVDESGDHLHANAYREGFNQMPLGGEATVELYLVQTGDDLRTGYIRPTSTEPRQQELSNIDITQFSLGDRFDGY